MPRIQIVKGVETELSDVDPRGMAYGTKVRDTETDDLYTLSPSNAALVPGSVIAVKGVTSARWIKDVPAGTDTPWLNANAQYVSPTGNDAHDGSGWHRAKLTIAAAMANLVGGGELHLADGLTGSIRIRGDGLAVPGWFNIAAPLRIVGHGKNAGQFGDPCAYLNRADSDPIIWLASTSRPLVIENIGLPSGANSTVVRNWDYRRNPDGTLCTAAITNWVRAAGQATITVALPPGLTITSATRVGTTVTLSYTLPAYMRSILGTGSWIRVNSTDVDFPSGDFQCIAPTVAHLAGSVAATVTLKYTQAGAAVTKANIGNMQSHNLGQYDRIQVTTPGAAAGAEIPSTSYRVASTGPDAVTVVLTDPYGGTLKTVGDVSTGVNRLASTTVANPGTYVPQDRVGYASSLVTLVNLQGAPSASNNYDAIDRGPTVDIGATADGRMRLINCSFTGYAPTNGVIDPDRACWLLVDAGRFGNGPGITILHSRPNVSGVRVYSGKNASWAVQMVDVQGDTDIGVVPPPALEVLEGNGFGSIYCDTVFTADTSGDVPSIRALGMAHDNCVYSNCGVVEGPGHIIGSNAWTTIVKSPYTLGQTGPWASGRVAGDTPFVRRAGGVVTARYTNGVQDGYTNWGGAAGSFVDDPYGGSRASRLTAAHRIYEAVNDPHTGVSYVHTTGDVWVLGAWFRLAGGFVGVGGGLMIATLLDGGTSVASGQIFSSFGGDGEWQWLTGSFTTPAPIAGVGTLRLDVLQPLDVFMPQLVQIPADGTTTLNERNELAATMPPIPYYLPRGLTGTLDGNKLVAHAGLCVGAGAIAAAGTGVAITNQMRVYDATGTLLGYVDVKT